MKTLKQIRQSLEEVLFKPLHTMDEENKTQQEQPIMVTEEVEETDEQVETTFAEDLPHDEKDPAFNCKPCRGEGLLITGNLCTDCKGTGKV